MLHLSTFIKEPVMCRTESHGPMGLTHCEIMCMYHVFILGQSTKCDEQVDKHMIKSKGLNHNNYNNNNYNSLHTNHSPH